MNLTKAIFCFLGLSACLYFSDLYSFSPDVLGKLDATQLKAGKIITLLKSNSGRYSHPKWSPKGDKVAYELNYELYMVNVSNKKVVQVGSNGRNPKWSSNGQKLAYIDNVRINVYDVRAKTVTPVFTIDEGGIVKDPYTSIFWTRHKDEIVFTYSSNTKKYGCQSSYCYLLIDSELKISAITREQRERLKKEAVEGIAANKPKFSVIQNYKHEMRAKDPEEKFYGVWLKNNNYSYYYKLCEGREPDLSSDGQKIVFTDTNPPSKDNKPSGGRLRIVELAVQKQNDKFIVQLKTDEKFTKDAKLAVYISETNYSYSPSGYKGEVTIADILDSSHIAIRVTMSLSKKIKIGDVIARPNQSIVGVISKRTTAELLHTFEQAKARQEKEIEKREEDQKRQLEEQKHREKEDKAKVTIGAIKMTYNDALASIKENNYKTAAQQLTKALALSKEVKTMQDPNQQELYRLLGDVQLKNKKYGEAMKQYKKYLSGEVTNSAVVESLVVAEKLYIKYEKAQEIALSKENAKKIKDKYAKAIKEYKNWEYNTALILLEAALNLSKGLKSLQDPSVADLHEMIGNTHLKLKNYKNAIHYYKNYLKLNSNNKKVKKSLKRAEKYLDKLEKINR